MWDSLASSSKHPQGKNHALKAFPGEIFLRSIGPSFFYIFALLSAESLPLIHGSVRHTETGGRGQWESRVVLQERKQGKHPLWKSGGPHELQESDFVFFSLVLVSIVCVPPK